MSEPIVFISRNRIVEGRGAEFEIAYGHAVGLIRATKPQTALFAAYADETGSEARIVHVFPNAEAMAFHFEGSADRTESAAGLIAPIGFDVYGQAPVGAIDQLRREASAAGASVEVLPATLGGFLRAPGDR
jgi:hypothetical protein